MEEALSLLEGLPCTPTCKDTFWAGRKLEAGIAAALIRAGEAARAKGDTLVPPARFFRRLGPVSTPASGGVFPRRRLDAFGHDSAAAEHRDRRAVRPSQNEHVGVQLQLVAGR